MSLVPAFKPNCRRLVRKVTCPVTKEPLRLYYEGVIDATFLREFIEKWGGGRLPVGWTKHFSHELFDSSVLDAPGDGLADLQHAFDLESEGR